MKQVIQSVRTGTISTRQLPDPMVADHEVLVDIQASVISAGTERYVVDLARKSLLGKARERPDHVKRVLQKVREEGLRTTLTQVLAKLDEPMPLGYSSAGIVLECGRAVQAFKPGDRVATAGPHASMISIGENLCAHIPDGVSFEQAAYTSIASIGLEGVRLARLTLGESVVVVGLGLIGQICVALLKANGCRVFGTDIDPAKLELAKAFGADEVGLGSPVDRIREFTRGAGVDAAIITAATPSNEPIEFTAEVCRTRGRIVLVGVVNLNLPRPPFFKKELEFTVSGSLGPGRGDPFYEEQGRDYPIGYARWTAQRNMQAVLDLVGSGQLPVERLTTHRFPIDKAPEAYDLITQKGPFLSVVLESEPEPAPRRRLDLPARAGATAQTSSDLGISVIGAGNFARLVMLPALSKVSGIHWRGLCTARGLNAENTGTAMGFHFAATDVQEVLNDKDTHAIFIATRHNLHADYVIACLEAGKHVFVEKPLCITSDELNRIDECVRRLGSACPVLMVGYNRRFAPASATVRGHFPSGTPLSVSFRFAPPYLPPDHWTQDPDVGGGRIIGEGCHAIDLCAALTGSVPVRVFAESVEKTAGVETTDDRVFITMRHANGSISSVSYQSGGDRAFPAERIEVTGAGRNAVIENWDAVQLWGGGEPKTLKGGKDKGHSQGFLAFVDACRKGGAWPVSWDQLRAVSWASIAAMESLRSGYAVNDEG